MSFVIYFSTIAFTVISRSS